MYIVRLRDNKKHSAWDSLTEALKQIHVLKDNGYRDCYFEEMDCNYSNGHYFV